MDLPSRDHTRQVTGTASHEADLDSRLIDRHSAKPLSIVTLRNAHTVGRRIAPFRIRLHSSTRCGLRSVMGLTALALTISTSDRGHPNDKKYLHDHITIANRSTGANLTSMEAVTRSLPLLPTGTQLDSWFVNEAKVEDLLVQWYQTSEVLDWPPGADVWIVAMIFGGYRRDDILAPPPFDEFVAADSRDYQSPLVQGAYFIWSRDTGMLAARGVLTNGHAATDWSSADRLIEVGHTVIRSHSDA